MTSCLHVLRSMWHVMDPTLTHQMTLFDLQETQDATTLTNNSHRQTNTHTHTYRERDKLVVNLWDMSSLLSNTFHGHHGLTIGRHNTAWWKYRERTDHQPSCGSRISVYTHNVTGHHRGLKPKLPAGYRVLSLWCMDTAGMCGQLYVSLSTVVSHTFSAHACAMCVFNIQVSSAPL